MEDFEFIDESPIFNDESMTRQEVAAALDLHVTEVRRIEQRAIEKLKRRLLFHPRYEEITEHTWERKTWLPRMF
jgi:hypothetical protein